MIRKIRKHFLKLFVAWVVVTTALVFFVLRSEYVADKAHHYLLTYLEEKLQSRVEMGRPEIGWIRGSWYIKNVSIRPHFGREKREFVAAKSVRISFFPWFNVLNREIGISSIELEEPSIYIRIEKGKVANLPALDFLKGGQGLFRFRLREVRISGGIIVTSYPERPMEIAFNRIGMKIRPDFDKNHYGFYLTESAAEIKIKDLAQKIISMKGDFSITPDNLTIIKSTFLLPEGNISAEGLYLKFATAEWVTKLSSELSLDAVRSMASRQWPVVSERVKELKGKLIISLVINGDRDGLEVKGVAKSGEVELDGFKIKDTSADFSSKGRWDSIKESSFDADLRSNIPLELANHYFESFPRLKGVAGIHANCSVAGGQWSAEGQKVKIEGDVTSPRIEVDRMPVTKVSALFKGDMERLEVTDINAVLLGGALNGRFSLDMKDDRGFNGKIQIGKIDLHEMGKFLSADTYSKVLSSGKLSGDIDITGGLDPELNVAADSSLQIEGIGVSYGESFSAKIPTTAINAKVSYAGRVTTLQPLDIATTFSALSVSGSVADGKMSLAVNLNSSNMGEFGGYLHGEGSFNGRISGPFSNPVVEGSLNLKKGRWGSYSVDAASGYLNFSDRILSSKGITINRGRSDIFLKGELSMAEEKVVVDASVEFKKGRLEDIAPLIGIDFGMKGEVSATGRIKGPLRSPDGEIDVKGKGITISGEEVDAVNIKGRLQSGRLFLDRGEVVKNGEKVTVAGEISPAGDMSLQIASSPLSIGSFSYIKRSGVQLNGSLMLRGDVSGNIRNPSFTGLVFLKDVRYKDIGLGNGNIGLSVSDMQLKASGDLFGSEITGTMAFKNNKPFHLRINAADLSLTSYLKGGYKLEGMTGNVSGTIEVEGELSNLREASGKGYISRIELVRDPFFIRNIKDVEIEMRGGRLIFKSFELSGKGTDLSASGWIGIDGETNLAVNGKLDLYLLQIFTGFIDKGEGTADVRLAISGSPPRMGGKISLRGGVIGFKGFDPLFTDISGIANLDGELLIVETLTGRIGEGRFKGDGSIQMAGLGLKRTDISIDLSGLHLSYPKWLPSEMEGNLRLTGDYPSLLLSGNMNVINARYGERVNWKTLLPSFRQRLKEPAALREGEGALKLDITFKADRNLIFDNNVGNAELKGEVRLKGDTSRFGIVGEVEVITGKVFYKEREFKINSGIIEFPDPKKFDAIFDFTAEGKIKDYIIQILLQGNINDFKVTMTSSPSLSELDIASLMSFGLTTKELQERGGGVPAYGAASVLTREVEDKFKDYIGFDRFHIDPYYSKVTGSTEPKLTVGKELTEDASVIYSRGLSGTGEQEVQMEYKLYRNFSLMGGWSSFGASSEGDVGADMKFRFEFR